MSSNQMAIEKTVAGLSYAGGGVSVGAALTLTDIGIIVGIVTALATLAVNWLYRHMKHRSEERERISRERREQAEHEARMELIRRGDL